MAILKEKKQEAYLLNGIYNKDIDYLRILSDLTEGICDIEMCQELTDETIIKFYYSSDIPKEINNRQKKWPIMEVDQNKAAYRLIQTSITHYLLNLDAYFANKIKTSKNEDISNMKVALYEDNKSRMTSFEKMIVRTIIIIVTASIQSIIMYYICR